MKAQSKFKPADYLSWNVIEDRVVVVDDQEGKVFRFNSVGTEVWNVLNGKRTVEDVICHIVNQFDATDGKVRKEVLHFLKQLYRQDLITEERC